MKEEGDIRFWQFKPDTEQKYIGSSTVYNGIQKALYRCFFVLGV